MDLREQLRQAVESFRDHPRRVLAASLGVFWGAAGIVVLMSYGAGFREYMRAEFHRFGRGVIAIHPSITSSGFPGFRRGVRVRFDREDAAAVERATSELVEAVLPEHLSIERVLVKAGDRIRRLDLHATDPRYALYRNFEIEHGRFYDLRDVEKRAAVAVLGHDAAVDLFGSARAALGRSLRVSGQAFEVIGVPRQKGRQYMNTHRPDNRLLLIPVTAAEARLGYPEQSLGRIFVVPRPGLRSADVISAVRASLGPRIGFHPDDRDAIRWYDVSQILGLVDLFYAGFMVFVGVAGTVTLLIGGVGIANYQLAILAERTLEIAVAKAVGARNRTLVAQAVIESGLVSGVTAALGVLVGVATCAALAAVTPAEKYPLPILSPVVAGVTLFAVCGVALLASLLPALRVRRIEISAALRGGV